MSSELRVDQLRKVFTTTTGQGSALKAAVDDVSFTIAAGEIVVLLGPSGCGKTTTLRCVAGLEHPTSGRIVIGGTVSTDPRAGVLVPPRNRNLGMVFQSYAVWPHMTVRQNVAYTNPPKESPTRGFRSRRSGGGLRRTSSMHWSRHGQCRRMSSRPGHRSGCPGETPRRFPSS